MLLLGPGQGDVHQEACHAFVDNVRLHQIFNLVIRVESFVSNYLFIGAYILTGADEQSKSRECFAQKKIKSLHV